MEENKEKEKVITEVAVVEISEEKVEINDADTVVAITNTEVQETKQENTQNIVETVNEETKQKKKKKGKKKGKKGKKAAEILDADFGPVVDFTKKEGFVFDPAKADADHDIDHLEKRKWEIQDVQAMLYLRRLERKHQKLVHGLASVRQLTPKQILKEEIREITKYNEDMRDEKQRENIRNGDWEYVDNEIHFMPDDIPELEEKLLLHEDKEYICLLL